MIASAMASLKCVCIKNILLIVSLAAILPQVYSQESVHLTLKGAPIANHSFVDVDDIGEGDAALLCHTNKTDCCMGHRNRAGEWYFSCNQDMKVGILGNPPLASSLFYRNRGLSVVRLNRHGNPSQRGCFRCEVPDANNVNQTIFVNIVDIGAINISPSTPIIGYAGGTIPDIICSTIISSSPPPQDATFVWFFGPHSNLSLPSGLTVSNYIINNNNNYTSTLQFSPLLPIHAGLYTCQFGGNQRLRRNASVTVDNFPPPEVEPMINKVTEGMNATFTLKFSGDSEDFQWQFNEADIKGEYVTMTMSLIIIDVTEMNEGNYTCIVKFSSFDGNITSKRAELLVFSSPIINTPLLNKIISLGDSTNFSVNASGDGLTYQWQKNDANISGNDSRIEGVLDDTLIITDAKAEDAGVYKCIVINGAGDSITSNEATLSVLSPPSITNYSFGSNYISIYWKQDDAVESYKIQYNFTIRQCADEMAPQNTTLNMIMATNSYIINNGANMPVEEDSDYIISLFAIKSGVSSPAAIIVNTTKEAAPSGAPVSIGSTSIKSISITITWNCVACDQRNGEIDGYSVTYYPEDEDTDEITTIVYGVTESNRTFLANGLQPLTNYTFEVQAFNGIGYGPEATATFQTLISEGIGFFLNGKFYANNSLVNLEEIGEGNKALLCLTSNTSCCESTSTVGWYSPAMSIMAEMNNTTGFYTSRGPSVIRLEKINGTTGSSGIFHCRIPDADGNDQTIYIGIYRNERGHPVSVNLTFMIPTLICVSTGGPATNVIWKRNEDYLEIGGTIYQQSQIITDNQNAEYKTMLTLPMTNIEYLDGTYECIVGNSRGSGNANLKLEGLRISDGTFIVGEPAMVKCTSAISVGTLMWRDEQENNTLVNSSSNTMVTLDFNPVNDSIHNKTFTCRAIQMGIVDKHTKINVSAPSYSVVNATIDYPQDNPIVGKPYNLTCLYNVSKGFTQDPAVLWKYPDGTNLNYSSIVFDALHASNNGIYTCEVTLTSPVLNDPEIDEQTYDLTIQLPSPDVSISVPNTTLYAGSAVNLTCTVTLIQEVDINVMLNLTWFQGSTLAAFNTTLISPLQNSFTKVLTLSPLSVMENNITCLAKIFPTENTSFFLEESPIESVSDILMVENPTINVTITPSSGQIPNVGNTFSITCAVFGLHLDSVEPVFTYQWTNHSDDSVTISSFEDRSTISFASLKLSNAGQYTCIVNVSSEHFIDGHVIAMKAYNLSIKIPEPSSVTLRSPPEIIYSGFNFTLYCDITLSMDVEGVLSSLEVNVTWKRPSDVNMIASEVQQSSENLLQYSTEVQFISVDNNYAGIYSCVAQVAATNSLYLEPSIPQLNTTEINIISAPSAPDLTSLTPVSSTSMQIVWMKGHGSDIVNNITVEYIYMGPCDCSEHPDRDLCLWSRQTFDGELFTVTISNLLEHSEYLFKIIADNPAGTNSSNEIKATTLSAIPSGVPESLNITASNLTSITINWSDVQCFDRNSDITEYIIKFNGASTTFKTLQFTASQLFPSTTYTFQIAAMSDNGTGPFNNITGSTTEPDEVGLLLNGELKSNNSVIAWSEIGEGSGSLFCLTNKTNCCEASNSGNWVDPDNNTVSLSPNITGVYQGHRKSSILLQHQEMDPALKGIFRCDVEDASNQMQHVYVGIYPQSENRASLNNISFTVTNEVNISFVLNCTSQGGPVNEMFWLHDNQPIQNSNRFPILADRRMGVYFNTLNVYGQMIGRYSCKITNEFNDTLMEKEYRVEVLQQPLNASAVWTNNEKAFYVCWKWTYIQSHLVAFNIFDANFSNLSYFPCRDRSYCVNLRRPPTTEDTVFIQTASSTALPSDPLPVYISEVGVSLMFNGTKLENGSSLSIDLIGDSEMALICRTNRNCCATPPNRQGEWYYPDGSKVLKSANSPTSFYRDRTDRGEVRLNNRRNNMQVITGTYCCEIPESDTNCGITQSLCITLVSFEIKPYGRSIAGENYTLTCEANATSKPSIVWLGPRDIVIHQVAASRGIVLQETIKTPNLENVYTSSITFAPLQASHAGEYKCTIPSLGSYPTRVSVTLPMIQVELSQGGTLEVGADHTFKCSSSGADKLNPSTTYQWTQNNGTHTSQVGNNSNGLSLVSLRLSDAGEYACTITVNSPYLNENISKNITKSLIIIMPDPISVSTENITNPEGGPLFIPRGDTTNISLICSVILNMLVDVPVTINYRWTRNDLASNTEEFIGNFTTTNRNMVTIISPLTPEKAGVYTCKVTVMPASTSMFIDGIGKHNNTTKVALYEIHITKAGGDNCLGNAISLNCTVEARGTSEHFDISWTYSQGPRTIITQNSTKFSRFLWFNSLRASHAGIYVCNASLAPTTGSEQTNITLPLRMNLTVSMNTSKPVRAGDSVSIICGANIDRNLVDVPVDVDLHLASPEGMNETQSFANSSGRSLHQTSIHFSNISAEVSGIFICNVNITASSMNKYLIPAHVNQTIDLILVPSRPSIDTIQITHNSITIAWSQAVGDRIDNYQISYDYQDRCTDHSYNSSHNSKQTNITLEKLEEFSNYQISITAMNSQGASSSIMNISTLSSAPSGEPQNVTGTTINSTSIRIQWKDVNCIKRNGEILAYNVAYRAVDYSQPSLSLRASPTVRSLVLNHLIPRTNYNLLVTAENINGTGPSREMTISTGDVEGVMLFHNDSFHPNNSIININEIGEGIVALFCFTNKLNCCNETLGLSGEWYFPNGSTVEKENNEGAIYRNRGPSVVRLNQKRTSSSLNGIFHCEIPLINGTNQSLYAGIYPRSRGKPKIRTFMFEANAQSLICTSTDGPATYVTWKRNGVSLPTQGIVYTQVQQITDTTTSIYTNTLQIRGVDPSIVAGNYSCSVSNLRGYDEQNLEIKDIRVTGHESAFPFGTPAAQLNCTTDLAVNLIEWLNAQGTVLKNGTDSLLELTVTFSESLMYTCRIKGVFGNQTKNITLTVLPEASSVSPSAATAIITVIILVVLLLVLIATSMFIVRRKRQGKLIFPQRVKSKLHSTFVIHATPLHGVDKDSDDDKLEMSIFGKSASVKNRGAVVPVEEFENHVKNMHNDRDQLFETEYASFRKDPQRSYAAADTMVNRLRNRFGNIFPYDHCRVKLKEIAGYEHSDYINASYIDGYQKPSAYIAAQGPLPNTLEDFWRMIWEKRLTTIVMLTQCFEGRKKCECYWPENINVAFEPGQGIKVILTSMVPFSEYTVRKMTVTRTTEPQQQPIEVTQFHFIAWPDHGVPDNCAVMLNFIRRVRKLHPYSNPCPLLVHCSAGVGRTGTFIVLDTMLERMKDEDTLNIYDYVKQLREQRVLMVQTLAQYMFIHDALKEYILCGQTEIIAGDIRNVIDNLSVQHDPCSAASGFEHQFQILGQLQYVTEENSYSNATSEQNIGKNRYSNKLPNNFYCVRLKSSAVPGSDYINASFIHGYRQKKTYIATQGPLESTVCDFWRMVWENESKCVVLLSQLKENDKEMCCCYWPTTEGYTQTYGQITVKLLTEERYGYCDLRKFEIDEEKAGVEGVRTAFTVTQFHFLEWPEHETPPITSSLIELMGNVNKVQMRAACKPMIVMCNDGVGRTGTFICIHAQLERLKTEGVLDFFQFIKSARMQRAGLISDSVQYVLCHEVLADYLDSFDTYANFKEVM